MPRALKREAEAAKQEKEDVTMKVETLEAVISRLVDMKEQQDVEVEVLGSRARPQGSSLPSWRPLACRRGRRAWLTLG